MMSIMEADDIHEYDDRQYRRRLSDVKRSSSEDHLSSINVDDEDDFVDELKPIGRPTRASLIPKLASSKTLSLSASSLTGKNDPPAPIKLSSSINTARSSAMVPSISRRSVQGVLVRFFRNGDKHHHPVTVAINEQELKSWEAFLNYLNRQPKLLLSSGGIKHIYTLNGREIRAITKFQSRHSYVVASSVFLRTEYRHVNDEFSDDLDTTVDSRWRSPPTQSEQIFLLPYSRLNVYESLIFNRSSTATFDRWLQDHVTDLLSRYINHNSITHLYAVTKLAFTEVKSFSQLFNMLKTTDTFIGCTDEEFEHSKHYLGTMRPSDFFINNLGQRKALNGLQRYAAKQGAAADDAKLSLSWIHGYDGTNEQTKTLYTVSDNEILYVIGSVCILHTPQLKQQRFYTKHTNPISCVGIHRCQLWVASSEATLTKDRSRVTLHIWNYRTLETATELRKEQFGSDISLLSFSPKADDTLLLIVSREKPKILLILDWKRNELIYSITCKSERILSALFVFNSVEWIACVSQQHLLFYQINWSSKPVRLMTQRESEVQNIYSGAMACDAGGERCIVGDKVGSVHVWRLMDDEPKLIMVKESILENDVQFIVPVGRDSFLIANEHNQIKIWSVKSTALEQIRLKDTFGSIQSICCLRQGSDSVVLAIGTKLHYILMKDIDKEQVDVIMRGHTSPPTGICCQKNSPYFFSISSDRYLFKWNNRTRSVEWSIRSAQLISCADLHPERNIIVLGTETSKLLIYDTLSSFYVATILLKFNTGVKSVRFSPNGSDLAVGLQNGGVCIYDVRGNGDFQLRTNGIAQSDNPPVTDVIWSADSAHLLAVYADNDYNIWSIPSFEVMKGKNVQTIQWYQVVHPIACSMLDKSIVETHSSAIALSPNLALCCGKDGQLRVFRNTYERTYQTLPFSLGSIQSVIPSTDKNTYLLSISDNPTIVEVDIKVES